MGAEGWGREKGLAWRSPGRRGGAGGDRGRKPWVCTCARQDLEGACEDLSGREGMGEEGNRPRALCHSAPWSAGPEGQLMLREKRCFLKLCAFWNSLAPLGSLDPAARRG